MNRSTQHAFEPEEIMAYLDGELEAQQAAALASHLEHCVECQAVATQLRQVSDRLLDFQVEPCATEVIESVLAATERNGGSILARGSEIGPRRRARLRILAWASASAIALLLVLGIAIPNYLRTKMAAKLATERSTGAPRDPEHSRLELFNKLQTPPPVSWGQPIEQLQTLAKPGLAVDSNGMLHGLGDHGANSLTVDGHAAPTDQQSKVFSNGPMIVQTASIAILAQNYDQASGQLHPLTAQHRGYAQDITANSQTGSARSLSATLRVPETQLEIFLADLRKLGHVEQETHDHQEITSQYVDLTARLKTSRATEQRILDILKTRTGNLGEVLQAEQELARIRGEIESMDGQRAHMEHQVSYATVQVQLSEEYREQLNPESYSTGRRLRNSLIEGLGNLTGGITALALFVFAYGPSIVFWLGVLAVPGWFIYRRVKISRKTTQAL